MQKTIFTFLLTLFCALGLFGQKYRDMIESGTFTLDEIREEAERHFDGVGRGRGTGYAAYKRWEYSASLELDDRGVKIPNFTLARQAQDYRRAEQKRQSESGGFAGDWKELGPTYWNATSGWNPGVGRVTSIGIDENDANHLIVGSPTGGVWKTLDGGANWASLTDHFSTVDVYALEINPHAPNVYLWGSAGGKIFRSVNAGESWSATGNVPGSGRVSRILFHPTDPDVVFACSESNGLYRSVNGGATWSGVSGLTGVSATPGYDVEFKPGDPSVMYFSGTSFFRSTDGGASFVLVSGFAAGSGRYKMIGVSPANPEVVYVLESNGGVFGAFYKSVNSGQSFDKLIDGSQINFFGYSAIGDDDRGQAPRDMDVCVSPFDADEVHIAGIHTWRSFDGGANFELTSYWVPGTAASLGVGYNHADIDILKYVGATLYVGSDGGLYTSDNKAQSFIDRSAGLGIREFYKIGVSRTDPNVVSGGSQDNGTSVMRGPNRAWVDWLGADGMETFVDWSNPQILYGTSQNGSMYRSSDQGNSRVGISKPQGVGNGAWVTPFEQDPKQPATIYVAFSDVWRSGNSGNSWTKISDLGGGNFNQMKLAPSDNQRIYISRGSALFSTADGGNSWDAIASAWGGAAINYIAVHPHNPERLLIVTASRVYHSDNAGQTWTNISAGLPSGAKYCAVWEDTGKNGIYVGGFGFVSYTNDELGGAWVGFFEGLPNTRVYELEINYVSETIFACTYGRGLWESPIYAASPPVAPVAAFKADQTQGCGQLTVQFYDQSANTPKSWAWTFEGGNPASSDQPNPTVAFNGAGAYSVSLTVGNDAGSATLEQTDLIQIVAPDKPLATDQQRCDPGEVQLVASGFVGDYVRWYDALNASAPIFTGDTLTVFLEATATFYAASVMDYSRTEYVGPISNAFGSGGFHGGNFSLVMDAEKPLRIKSALVYARDSKDRTFVLRDGSGAVIAEKTLFVVEGESRVALDLDLPVGQNLRLTCLSPAELYRNAGGAAYPYAIDGALTLKGATGGAASYPYFYDLEVQFLESCESERVAATATVTPCSSMSELDFLSRLALSPNPATDYIDVLLELERSAMVLVEVFDEKGALVYADNWGALPPGAAAKRIAASAWPAGAYFVRLILNGQRVMRKTQVKR